VQSDVTGPAWLRSLLGMKHIMTKTEYAYLSVVTIFILFGVGCSRNSSRYDRTSSTNDADVALSSQTQLQAEADTAAPEGVFTESGTKPFSWPKLFAPLPPEEKIRYRDTECLLDALSEEHLGDKETFIHVTERGEQIGRIWLPGCGQFGILDVNSPLPILECWSERYDGLFCRSLLVPMRDGGRLHYGGCYTEVYTPEKNRALLPEAYEVRLSTKAKTKTVYFFGRLKTATTMDAEKRLREAHSIQ